MAIKWKNTPKQRYFAVGLGVVVGTLFLPLLAPWGIYFLFKVFGTKLFEKVIHWINRFNRHREASFFESTDESSGEFQMESICTHEACVDFSVSDASDSNSEIQQSTDDPDQAAPSESVTPVSDMDDDEVQFSCQEDENAADANRVLALLGVIEDEDEDEDGDEEFSELEDICYECRRTVRRPDDGREVFSDVEDDCGRRDTQRLWARKVVSETFVGAKIPNEDFNEREVVSGLRSSPCIIHQKRNEVRQASNGEETKGTVIGGQSSGSLGGDSSGVQINQGPDTSCAPQCQDMKDLPDKGPKKRTDLPEKGPKKRTDLPDKGPKKRTDLPEKGPKKRTDLPEKGPKKKAKRRRKKRTGKQVLVEDPNSSSASELNDTSQLHHGTPPLQRVNDEAGKGKANEIQEDTEITPDKKPKTGNPVRKSENPSADERPETSGTSNGQGISERCTHRQFEQKPDDESKHCLYAGHFNHID